MTARSLHPAAAEGFSRNADDYERTRPGYPPDAVAFLAEVLDMRAGTTVADVAAGTGKLTRLLVPTGARVIAVEPVEEMRSLLAATVAGAEVLDGVAEHLPLADASVDAVTVAQAFHWFDGPAALAEFARVLRPGGALAVVYNHRDREAPWLAAVNRVVEAYRRGTPQQWDGRWRGAFEHQTVLTALRKAEFDNAQLLTPEGFLGRMRSMSYVGALPAPEQQALLAEIASVVATDPETAGRDELVIGQRTSVHTWRRR
jgi:ubiquinone/menaquinone biosynthesis C-methylase UbiE